MIGVAVISESTILSPGRTAAPITIQYGRFRHCRMESDGLSADLLSDGLLIACSIDRVWQQPGES